MSFTKDRVEFKTQDGTTLRGNLTLTGEPNAPAVIMIAGVRHAMLLLHFMMIERTAKNIQNSLLS